MNLWRSSLVLGACLLVGRLAEAQVLEVRNAAGLRMTVDPENRNPGLRVVVPGAGQESERSFTVLFPEHVTVRAQGETEAKHLYLWRPGMAGEAPQWKRVGDALEYARELGEIHFVARATLVGDGIVFRYEFGNGSSTAYDMATAITDPRFRTIFYDPRLERTYVHGEGGFALLGSETPERLTMPLSQWFPVRYLAQFTAPIPAERVRREDGITYIYRSQTVDVPMVATVSADGKWVAASFARAPGNVWSNPELTCQHVDPTVALPPHGSGGYEVKILILKGTLQEALGRVREQRGRLQ